MLLFGYLSDRIGRKFGMMASTAIIALFSFLSACAQGAHNNPGGLFAALSAYRFCIGVGFGAEYPCGSVAASEQSEEESISKKAQHRWFVLATNTMIDLGFVMGAFVPLVLVWIFGEEHLNAVWRGSFAFGIIPTIGVFLWRLRMTEPARFKQDSMKDVKVTQIPYWLILRRYWFPLTIICLAWFIYDFITYPFGLFSSTVTSSIVSNDASLAVVLGWNVIINLFYLPGSLIGASLIDYIGPKYTMISGLILQAIIGFFMSGFYPTLKHHVAGFTVMYGIFLSFGEFGPGNCLGLLASKTGPTAVRGQFYGIAAAVGKVGAFAGTYAFTPLVNRFGGFDSDRGNSGPFFVASGLVILNAVLIMCLKPMTADGMKREDEDFRSYLQSHGFDVSLMGLKDEDEISVQTTREKDIMSPPEKGIVV